MPHNEWSCKLAKVATEVSRLNRGQILLSALLKRLQPGQSQYRTTQISLRLGPTPSHLCKSTPAIAASVRVIHSADGGFDN
ncbi:hypothetical protein PCANC_09503 [Puccinia coronata f. sp. avenae]|uniref:Uncharacterized protein n=1 Tax=Puccinia coronata f. sp. avenae TaxID=200324 RepID=A0A2N5UMR7_9BASI|nr:hypothetical protein PCASD_08960 [Puccinia coronata f. sp. avenae]PLW54024.1 hypothetical protein PCANC_09503 [Puccinia coronata f. sp. avenae]